MSITASRISTACGCGTAPGGGWWKRAPECPPPFGPYRGLFYERLGDVGPVDLFYVDSPTRPGPRGQRPKPFPAFIAGAVRLQQMRPGGIRRLFTDKRYVNLAPYRALFPPDAYEVVVTEPG